MVHIFEVPLSYYLWVLTLSLAFSSALLLIKFSLRTRKTLIGKTVYYVSLSFLLWGLATISMAAHHIEQVEVYGVMYMLLASLASLAAIFAAYYGWVIKGILISNDVKVTEPKLSSAVLSALAFTIGFVGFARYALNNSLLNAMMEGTSILTGLGLMFLSAPLIVLIRPRISNKTLYLGGGLTLTIAFTALIGHLQDMPNLYAPLSGGGVSISTVMSLIAASIGLILARHQDVRAKIILLISGWFVLFIAVLALLGYLWGIPGLYDLGPFSRLSIPTALGLILIGTTLFWRSWKTL